MLASGSDVHTRVEHVGVKQQLQQAHRFSSLRSFDPPLAHHHVLDGPRPVNTTTSTPADPLIRDCMSVHDNPRSHNTHLDLQHCDAAGTMQRHPSGACKPASSICSPGHGRLVGESTIAENISPGYDNPRPPVGAPGAAATHTQPGGLGLAGDRRRRRRQLHHAGHRWYDD